MGQTVFIRLRQVLQTNVETALDLAERASGPVLMKEAARQLERVEEQLRREKDQAQRRLDQAAAEQEQCRTRATEMAENARYALGKGREDLAKAALARQLDLEREIERLATVQTEGRLEMSQIDEAVTALAARARTMRAEMERAARLGATAPAGRAEPVKSRVARALDQADRLFDKALGEKGPAGDPLETALKMADIEAMKRDDAIEERLAALRAKAAAPAKGKSRKRA